MILEDTEIQKISDMLNSNIMPDIYTRTKYVLQFNNKLQNKIINLNNPNICYLDVTTFTYNHDVGIICEDFYIRILYTNRATLAPNSHPNSHTNSHRYIPIVPIFPRLPLFPIVPREVRQTLARSL